MHGEQFIFGKFCFYETLIASCVKSFIKGIGGFERNRSLESWDITDQPREGRMNLGTRTEHQIVNFTFSFFGVSPVPADLSGALRVSAGSQLPVLPHPAPAPWCWKLHGLRHLWLLKSSSSAPLMMSFLVSDLPAKHFTDQTVYPYMVFL